MVRVILLLGIVVSYCELLFAQGSAAPQKLPTIAPRNPSSSYVLKGTLVTPEETIREGSVFILGDKIQAIGKDIQVPGDVQVIGTGSFIYPGLIDLHNHITWNFLPRWNPPRKFSNRYEWLASAEYETALKTPHDTIVPPPPRSIPQEASACDANQYGEVKAIIGGATSIVDSLGNGEDSCVKGLVRNLSSYSGLQAVGTSEKLSNKVFPLELSNDEVAQINKDLDDGHHALVAHLAEGKQHDASAAREFRMFKARGFLRDGVSIIHGTALSEVDFIEMAKNHVGLIWSPRSNIELYGETTNVRAAKQSGVKISLSPDWSPTGSDGVLEELSYAAAWNAAQNPRVFTGR